MTFSARVLSFYKNINPDVEIPPPFSWINPFENSETRTLLDTFYTKYFNDDHIRYGIFGINPGRFGAGVTGIPFTDPKILEELCNIKNDCPKRFELSADFIYKVIQSYGNIEHFYKSFFITSICPLGFLKNGINCNYYDDKELQNAVEPFILSSLKSQIHFGLNTQVAFCLGKGENFKYFNGLNARHSLFEKIIPLPHPRWVMQYNRKQLTTYINQYIDTFNVVLQK